MGWPCTHSPGRSQDAPHRTSRCGDLGACDLALFPRSEPLDQWSPGSARSKTQGCWSRVRRAGLSLLAATESRPLNQAPWFCLNSPPRHCLFAVLVSGFLKRGQVRCSPDYVIGGSALAEVKTGLRKALGAAGWLAASSSQAALEARAGRNSGLQDRNHHHHHQQQQNARR